MITIIIKNIKLIIKMIDNNYIIKIIAIFSRAGAFDYVEIMTKILIQSS